MVVEIVCTVNNKLPVVCVSLGFRSSQKIKVNVSLWPPMSFGAVTVPERERHIARIQIFCAQLPKSLYTVQGTQ